MNRGHDMPLTAKKNHRQTRKIERIEARILSEQRRRIERAAALKGTSISDFVVSSLDEAARRTIEEHESWTLTGRDREIFVNALLHPPAPNQAMRAAFRSHKKRVQSS
jgi:uncharacterized protein (DUF1778 family)